MWPSGRGLSSTGKCRPRVAAHALYRDFFRFLEALTQSAADPWAAYQQHYLSPHRQVLEAYWQQVIGLGEAEWRSRVQRVKPGDYAQLRSLVQSEDLSAIADQAISLCRGLLPAEREPEVYYLIGFFSPEAFLLQLDARWEIAVGLERFHSLRRLPLYLCHEYAHWARRNCGWSGPESLAERLASEGIAVVFTQQLLPDLPLHEHLFMHRSRFNAVQEARDRLWQEVGRELDSSAPEILQHYFAGVPGDSALPPRAGLYLGYLAVEVFRHSHRDLSFGELIQVSGKAIFSEWSAAPTR